ncbi:hypothetical protein [Candidatus Regiella insecticola]|uniref:hypothetical protein n=1 Tax=Candidatus Regiella insecticola TaxID=138073 RepID=UPI0012FEC7B2|nr:hypothetical protein [Candidatus Regiella insecticola]
MRANTEHPSQQHGGCKGKGYTVASDAKPRCPVDFERGLLQNPTTGDTYVEYF